MSDCVFCNIIDGSDESGTKVMYSGDGWVAFSPLREVTPGHTLVIPTHHVENFLELSPLDAVDVQEGIQTVGTALMEQTGADGMNLISSHGEAATQTQFHLHYHLVPRYADGDNMRLWDKQHDEKWKAKHPETVIELAVEAYRTI